MSAQILLQGRLQGAAEFLLSAPAGHENRAFENRLMWLTLMGEVLPRALLAELRLPVLMLGSSGGGRFLVILPDQTRADAADTFLTRAADSLNSITGGTIRLEWSSTENLGDWTVIRKRLQDGLRKKTQLRASEPGFFGAFEAPPAPPDVIPGDLREAMGVGFSFDFPALLAAEGGTHRWDLSSQAGPENIALTRHTAHTDSGPASAEDLAAASQGAKLWGVLRGEIDDFGTRMRRVQSVEEHVQLSLVYKQFLAGEIELLCSQGEYFRRVTVLTAGSADFAVYGAWDALAGFARELQRVFGRFAEENLKELPGAEAKTITMALNIAEPDATLAGAWEDCGRDLEIARSSDKDCLYIFGRVLEWKELNDAAELKDAVGRINEEFRGGRQFLGQLRNLYRKVEGQDKQDEERLRARAARFQRRFARVANRREREFMKLRAHLMKEVAGRGARGKLKLRPEGLVALEWARLAGE